MYGSGGMAYVANSTNNFRLKIVFYMFPRQLVQHLTQNSVMSGYLSCETHTGLYLNLQVMIVIAIITFPVN